MDKTVHKWSARSVNAESGQITVCYPNGLLAKIRQYLIVHTKQGTTNGFFFPKAVPFRYVMYKLL